MWRYGWWNLWIAASITAAEVPGEMNSLLNAPKVKAPGVFIVTGADLLVPREYQKLVVDAYAGPKHLLLMEGAAHNSAMTPQESDQLQKELDWVLPQIRGTKFEASNE